MDLLHQPRTGDDQLIFGFVAHRILHARWTRGLTSIYAPLKRRPAAALGVVSILKGPFGGAIRRSAAGKGGGETA